jgi:hypothetical protein
VRFWVGDFLENSQSSSGSLKNDFGEVDETIFRSVFSTYELIFCILGIEKFEMDEFALVMFLIGELPRELIICLLNVLKNDFL